MTESMEFCGKAALIVLVFASTAQAAPPITAAVFSPDGESVVLGSQDGIEIRACPSLEIERRLTMHLAHVHDLVFSPDGKQLAAAGGTPAEVGEVEIFSWPSGESMVVHKWHDDLVYGLAWRTDGNLLATASADRSVALHAEKDQWLKGHSAAVTSVAFLPGGDYLVSASRDNSLRVWEVSTGTLLRTMDNHTAPVHDLAVQPMTGDALPVVASASADRTVRLWQPTIGRMVRFAKLPAEPVDIDWTPNGEKLLAACTDNTVYVIDPDSAQIIARIQALVDRPFTIVAAPDGQNAVVAGNDGKVTMFSLLPAGP